MSGVIIPDKLPIATINNFRKSVLAWYDKNRRVLPWRALPGDKPDPYHVWLSEVMLQQTVVATVIPYFLKFLQLWPAVKDMANAEQEDVLHAWAGLGYYARARNLHKCAQKISTEFSGIFPQTETELKSLPGIGDYTAAAILSIAFDKPSVVIDGNVERVMTRFFGITEPLPASKPQIRQAAALLAAKRTDRPSDYAQALMDLGATVCIPKTPRCSLCPLQRNCQGKKMGIAADLPAKRAQKAKPFKKGYVYWLRLEKTDEIMLERRAETGLFGGMAAFPTSEWLEKGKIDHPAHILKWGTPTKLKGRVVRHSFTHFDLELQGYEVILGKKPRLPGLLWTQPGSLEKSGLPSLFQKFARIMMNNNNGR